MIDINLTATQLAERWSLSTGTLENWRGQNKGPAFIKLGESKGARILYRMSDVLSFEKLHERLLK